MVDVNPARQPGDPITEGRILRRVFPSQSCYPQGRDAPPSSQSFEPKAGDAGISADLEDLCTPEEVLRGHEGFGLVALDVTKLVTLGFQVTYEPTSTDQAHVLVSGNFSKSNRRKLAQGIVDILAKPVLRG